MFSSQKKQQTKKPPQNTKNKQKKFQPVSFVFVSYFYVELNVYNRFTTGEYAFISLCSLLLC